MIKTTDKENFFNNSKFLQLHKGFFLWTGTYDFSRTLLMYLSYCKSSSDLLSFIYLSDLNFFLENEEAVLFLRELEKHSYGDLVTSLIFYYLQLTYKEKKKINFANWDVILPGALHPATTDSVFLFLEEFNILHFLRETKTEKDFITGLLLYFQIKGLSAFKSPDLKEIQNLLKFLKVDLFIISELIEKTHTTKNFKKLTNFLEIYRSEL